ncbi:helix-turn-helix transcriptional regulator [Paenibacillus sp. MWE-103]|uniref:Helix-turn-helix transcriptional regulator n=1 Tax=Paenibacillus artemisiicola TaxID=1172618 RepID=A0ABS3WGE2_9BACL|nr:helix-turn-helix transcriptional regulator [Paenibacillus artemisiicola]MBO7747384.1 helix-turn-helix transcriptional regulator [Paenibacillus artemisiicola]
MLSQRLRSRRKELKLTQEKLAEMVNTKKTTISNYETGYSTPNNEMLSDLADVLKTTSDFLLGRTDDPAPGVSETATEKTKQDPAKEGSAFFGGADKYTEEELAIADAAARAAVEAYRLGKKKREEK